MHLADTPLTWSPLNAHYRIENAADGRVAILPARRKVIIYGAGLGKRQALPYLMDQEWEVWALNLIPPIDGEGRVRADRWFDIHQRVAQTADDLRWIAACPRPIYVPPDLADVSPRAVVFPLERIEAAFGDAAEYFTCTFAYQIALALLEGFADIGLFGVELAFGTRRERSVEYACVSWWMGYATAKGVRLRVPTPSRLGKHRFLYGLEYAAEIDDVDRYLADSEMGLRHELETLDLSRRIGRKGVALPSVGG